MNKKSNDQVPSSTVFDGVIEENRNPLLEKLTGYLFRKIDFDNESLQTLREYAGKTGLVYVSSHGSNISLIILYNLLKRHNLDLPGFALEYNPFLLQTIRYIGKRIGKFFSKLILRKKYEFIFESNYIEELIHKKKSIILSLLSKKFFLRRYLEIKYDSLIYLIDLQKKLDSPIYLFPEMIFWNMNPERSRNGISSKATGDRGLISGLFTMLISTTPGFIRVSTPINLKDEIEDSNNTNSEYIAIDVRNKLLEMYHHEKRTVLGPVIKSRQEMMEKVLYHEDVLNKIEKMAMREKVPARKLRKKAYKCFKEIAADYSILTIKMFSISLNIILNKLFDGISYDIDSIRRIREAAKKGPLILVPSHKSHVDYLIISHLFYQNKLIPPHIAAGINLSFFPFGNLFRHSGAFFIRRSFLGQKLYVVVFRQYIRTLISEGYSIEYFMEGGRTRTGKLIQPQLGFLYFLIEAINSGYNEDLVFVPISINYDRILEEKAHMKEIEGSEKQAESVKAVVKGRKLLKKKYGKVYVSFNEPFTLKEITKDITDVKKIPNAVANNIFNKINEVTVVNSFALTTSAILLLSESGFSKNMLKDNVVKLFDYLIHTKARMSDALHHKSNIEGIIRHVLKSYLHDHILEEISIEGENKDDIVDDFYVLKDDNRKRIGFYKNCIIHYFVPLAFVSLAILCARKGEQVEEESIRSEYEFIKDLFHREFVYSNESEEIQNVYEYLLAESVIANRENGHLILEDDKVEEVIFYSKIIKDQLESYFVVLNTLINSEVNRVKRDSLLVDIRKKGYRMYHLGEIDLAESLSVPNYNNALDRFSNDGILKGGNRLKKSVEVTIADLEKAQELLTRVNGYLEVIG